MWKPLAIALALALPGVSQTQAALREPGGAAPLTIRRLVPEVQMVIAAEDHHGHPRLDLAAAQVRVLDNGRPARLTSLQAAPELPLRIALLLDHSESMKAGFAAERRAGLAWLGQLQDSGGVIFTLPFAAGEGKGDGSTAARPFSGTRAGGQTALYDALIHAARRLASPMPARRVLLLFSDGEDNYSRASLGEAIAILQEWNIAVYSVTAHSSRLEFPGDRVLREISAATGGRAYLFPNYSHAGKGLAALENDARGQYVVGFHPVGRLTEGEFHAVKITAPGTKIRARAGYYVSRESGAGSQVMAGEGARATRGQ
jgi:Ca-activated chloride channel family protein